jgi:hypothetical protein
MTPDHPCEPWLSFLSALDAQLNQPADLHCMGGFAVSQIYGFDRQTADLDVLLVTPREAGTRVLQLAGRRSNLQKKHSVYIDYVGVANYPADYEERLHRVFPIWVNVCLWALEPHDLALTKLERSNEQDIRDVVFLARSGLIQRQTLVSRFEAELEPYITGRTSTWHQTTLGLWLEECWPDDASPTESVQKQ